MPNLCIEAGPGTGKTYTITNGRTYSISPVTDHIKRSAEQQVIFDYLRKHFYNVKKAVFFSYGKAIQVTLDSLIDTNRDKSFTFSGFGQSQVFKKWRGYQKLDPNRPYRCVETITGKLFNTLDKYDQSMWISAIKFVDACKREWMYPTIASLEHVCNKYPEIGERPNMTPDIIPFAEKLIDEAAKRDGSIDHSDQLWLGACLTTEPVFDLGFIDEAQDQSRVCLELAKRACKNLVYCGDPNQAIYAFAGADHEGFQRAIQNSELVLPLKLSFRCPPNICDLANRIRPTAKLRPLPEALPGSESKIEGGHFDRYVRMHDGSWNHGLIVCRTNGPLVRNCLSFLRNGIPSVLIQNDITKHISSIVERLGGKSMNLQTGGIEMMRNRAIQYRNGYRNHKSPSVEMLIEERVETITSVLDEMEANYNKHNHSQSVLDVFNKYIGDMYKHDPKRSVRFSTIHKSKGLESHSVYILNPPIPHFLAKGEVALEQEKNLEFVAVTRVKRNLIWVENV